MNLPAIDANFQVCAIFGHPVGHSLSPALHNAGFAALNLPLVYVAHDIEPERLGKAMEAARTLNYRGLSITIPHKVAAMAYMDKVDPAAQAIGCVNTVVNDQGRLIGYNSDGRGALNALKNAGFDPAGKKVVLLGSGGAARAIAMTLGLEAAPEKLTILGVNDEEMNRLASDVAKGTGANVETATLNFASLARLLPDAHGLLQCTPVGMHPHGEQSPVDPSLLHSRLVVFDAVYNPRRTRLLRDAAAAGSVVVEGIEMFLGQALVQFALWTGRDLPASVMRKIL